MDTLRNFVTSALVFFAVFSVLPGASFAKYSGGSGSSGDPYQIATAADLLALSADTNDYDQCFVLTADIDLAPGLPGGQIFTTAVIAPDSNSSNFTFDDTEFTGKFDGGGHKILNMTIDCDGADWLGLFGYVLNAEIKGVHLKNSRVTGGDGSYQLGALAGCCIYSNISNCSSQGTVESGSSSYNIGGLIGEISGCSVVSCASSCGVTVTSGEGVGLGGLIGFCGDSSIGNCCATGDVTAHKGDVLGGLTGGCVYTDISNCYATGDVTIRGGGQYIGGLLGANNSSNVYNCYFLLGSGPDNGYGEPLTRTQMKQQASFVGWDFIGETANGTEDIWWINEGIDYPKLSWLRTVIEAAKCKVAAGSKIDNDKISISGLAYILADDFENTNVVKANIGSGEMDPCIIEMPIDEKTYKNGRYKFSGGIDGAKISFKYDTKTSKFTFSASKIDLTGLTCPMDFEIIVDSFHGIGGIDESIANGPKKPIPINLMMGIKNMLRVDKSVVKRSKKSNGDQLSVKGGFAVKNMVDMAGEEFVVTLGSQQTFTVPIGSFKASKSGFVCKNAALAGGGFATANFNFSRCTFTLTIKKMKITENPGVVNLGIEFGGFYEAGQIVLP
ncbi:MAG: hypothetical protein JW749_12500 [Sedimentisphaerales bacterium]|nr:hypothetical protein [Sedimentisphaerales bacterium]